jgi:hypothetical protein
MQITGSIPPVNWHEILKALDKTISSQLADNPGVFSETDAVRLELIAFNIRMAKKANSTTRIEGLNES